MRILFAITVGCFCVLLWVALALARRIRLAQLLQARPLRRPSRTREFFEAGEFRTPRSLRLEQEILQQKPRRHLSEMAFAHEPPSTVTHNPKLFSEKLITTGPVAVRPAAAYASLFGQTVPIARIDSRRSSTASEMLPPPEDTAVANTVPTISPVPFTLHRKPPQATRALGLRRRVDLSHFNKDMGDLTDPYTHLLRSTGTQGPIPTDSTNR